MDRSLHFGALNLSAPPSFVQFKYFAGEDGKKGQWTLLFFSASLPFFLFSFHHLFFTSDSLPETLLLWGCCSWFHTFSNLSLKWGLWSTKSCVQYSAFVSLFLSCRLSGLPQSFLLHSAVPWSNLTSSHSLHPLAMVVARTLTETFFTGSVKLVFSQ